ncbi:hypothetical protein HIM_03869 [Hirsutella minnesotensis 3608]|uniref:Enoyl reductase (ER) domain-containing protein n=1 Tax=Hirsutella minnesotensis 3608 TaxID=1043627 RepID=A0A0F7ZVF7_9HYPO|nr:hypothetical protein HIM_03869 [Hirsutella minnesotensis 3608]
MALPTTQRAVAIAAKRAPLVEIEAPVYPPAAGEVCGGGGLAGSVVAVGEPGDSSGSSSLAVGDRVMAFAFHGGKEANHQELVTVPTYLVSRVPPGLTTREACTVPVNLVTVFHAATADLGFRLPWPLPEAGWMDPEQDRPVVVWGASSSVGIYALQVLRHWGYRRLLAVSSARHHEYLSRLGAAECFDRADPNVADAIVAAVGQAGPEPGVPYILDCIGSLQGSLRPLTRVAKSGSRVAVMLPVIVKDATDDEEPEYEMDVTKCLQGMWADGVVLRGVRTHFYLDVRPFKLLSLGFELRRGGCLLTCDAQNEFFQQKLQPEIVPALLAEKVVEPNQQRVVEGATMLERAQGALNLLRSKARRP